MITCVKAFNVHLCKIRKYQMFWSVPNKDWKLCSWASKPIVKKLFSLCFLPVNPILDRLIGPIPLVKDRVVFLICWDEKHCWEALRRENVFETPLNFNLYQPWLVGTCKGCHWRSRPFFQKQCSRCFSAFSLQLSCKWDQTLCNGHTWPGN